MLLVSVALLAFPAAAQPVPEAGQPTPERLAETRKLEAAFEALPEAERTARLAAARRMSEAAGTTEQMRGAVASVTAFLMPMFLKGNEAHGEQVSAIVSREFLGEADHMLPALVAQSERRHAEVFSVAELDAMAEFYRSPAGKRMIAEMPALSERLMRDGGAVGAAAMRAALPRIIDRLKAAKLSLPTTS